MSDMETELRRAFARRQPSTGFAHRVTDAMRERRSRKRRRQRWLAVAVVVLVCGWGGGYWRMRLEAARTMDQLNLAVQITGEKLSFVRETAARGLLEREVGKNVGEKE